MKRKEKPMTMDEAVEKLAALLEPVWSKFTPEEKPKDYARPSSSFPP